MTFSSATNGESADHKPGPISLCHSAGDFNWGVSNTPGLRWPHPMRHIEDESQVVVAPTNEIPPVPCPNKVRGITQVPIANSRQTLFKAPLFRVLFTFRLAGTLREVHGCMVPAGESSLR
jgi:hypothetical protein